MKLVFKPVFNLSIPRRGSMRLRPEILDRIGSPEFEWNQVINLVVAGAARYDAVFAVDLPLHFRRYIAHFSGVSVGANIWSCNIKRVAGSHVRVGKNRRRFLGEQDPGEKQQ